MGIWMELGIFLVVLAFGFWQLWDVKKARAERIAREKVDKSSTRNLAD
jgi:ABC-type nickel/cobalt efflux system permease component RcnA